MGDRELRSKVAARFETPCTRCPLRLLPTFRSFTADELEFIEHFKIGEQQMPAGGTVFDEGQPAKHLYTLLSGWAMKHKTLADGRRQIINYALPGDLVGIQGAMFGKMQHGVEALSDLKLCVFDRERIWTLYNKHPGLAFDVTWLAAREKSIISDFLVSVGQRSASERIAFLLLSLFVRARNVGLVASNGAVQLPINQEHLADTIGFSLVHTNKSLARLRRSGAFEWNGSQFRLLDEPALVKLAGEAPEATGPRPFI